MTYFATKSVTYQIFKFVDDPGFLLLDVNSSCSAGVINRFAATTFLQFVELGLGLQFF